MTASPDWTRSPYIGYGPGGPIFIDPASLLARTAMEALGGHRVVRTAEGEPVCGLCGEIGPCPTARNAIEVCRAAGATAAEIRRIGVAGIIPVARPKPPPAADAMRATVTVVRGRTIGRVDMSGNLDHATAREADEIPPPRRADAFTEPTAAYPTVSTRSEPGAEPAADSIKAAFDAAEADAAVGRADPEPADPSWGDAPEYEAQEVVGRAQPGPGAARESEAVEERDAPVGESEMAEEPPVVEVPPEPETTVLPAVDEAADEAVAEPVSEAAGTDAGDAAADAGGAAGGAEEPAAAEAPEPPAEPKAKASGGGTGTNRRRRRGAAVRAA
ncbi:hypothetical protein [Rhizomonospora bruguierae]|uniref:hypothetical protein n=1 Tax=Rhizomonospora bruguierae TaxID=1581705 RepID=UPI001BD13280|nr:hypothetical protein [Micromonospora sp. NBRC 107566]